MCFSLKLTEINPWKNVLILTKNIVWIFVFIIDSPNVLYVAIYDFMFHILQMKPFSIFCWVSCYVWQLYAITACVELNIFNSSWIENYASLLYKYLTKMKRHFLVENLSSMIKHGSLFTHKQNRVCYVHFCESSSCFCIYYLNY